MIEYPVCVSHVSLNNFGKNCLQEVAYVRFDDNLFDQENNSGFDFGFHRLVVSLVAPDQRLIIAGGIDLRRNNVKRYSAIRVKEGLFTVVPIFVLLSRRTGFYF